MSEAAVGGDDEPTRFFAHEVAAEEIVPVAPPAPGFDPKEPLETSVPTDPGEVEFKRAGEETGASKKKKKGVATDGAAEPAKAEEGETPPASAKAERPPAAKAKPPAAAKDSTKEASKPWSKNQRKAMLAGGGALALLAAVAGGSLLLAAAVRVTSPLEIPDLRTAPRSRSRTGAARRRRAGARRGGANSWRSRDRGEQPGRGRRTARQAAGRAAGARERPGAGGRRNGSRRGNETDCNVGQCRIRQCHCCAMRRRQAQRLSASASASRRGGGRRALRPSFLGRGFGQYHRPGPVAWRRPRRARQVAGLCCRTAGRLSRAGREPAHHRRAAARRRGLRPATTTTHVAPRTQPRRATDRPPAAAPPAFQLRSWRSSTRSSSSGRSLAKQVIRMGEGGSPTQKANAQLAKNYDKYLANVADSARGANSDRESDRDDQAGQPDQGLYRVSQQAVVAVAIGANIQLARRADQDDLASRGFARDALRDRSSAGRSAAAFPPASGLHARTKHCRPEGRSRPPGFRCVRSAYYRCRCRWWNSDR